MSDRRSMRFARSREWLGRPHTTSLLGVGAESALSLVGSVAVARLLLPEGRGELGRWIYWSGVAIGVGGLGMSTALPQLVGAHRLSLEDSRATFGILAGALGPAALLLGFLFTDVACPDGGFHAGWYWMLGAAVPGGVVGAIGAGMLVAAGRIRALMVTRALATLVRVLALGALLLVGSRSVTLASAAFGLSIAATGVVSAVLARPALPTRGIGSSIWPLLSRGGAIHAPALVGIALTVVNQGWVYSQLPSADAGLYAVAAGAAATLQVVSLAELTASTVAMSDAERGWAGVRIAMRRVSAWSGVGVLTGVAAAPFALPLVYGAAYSPAVLAFCLLLAATGAENIGRVGQAALQCRGYPKTAWLVDGVRAIALVACMARFGVAGGIVGVAAATVASQLAGVLASGLLLGVARGTSERAFTRGAP